MITGIEALSFLRLGLDSIKMWDHNNKIQITSKDFI